MILPLVIVLSAGLHVAGRRADQPGFPTGSNVGVGPMFSSVESSLSRNTSGHSSRQSPSVFLVPTPNDTLALAIEESKESTAQPRNARTTKHFPNSSAGIVSVSSSLWGTLSPRTVASAFAAQVPLVTSFTSGTYWFFSRFVSQLSASPASFAKISVDAAVMGKGALAEPATAKVSELPEALMIESSSQSNPTKSTLAQSARDASSMFFMLINMFASVMFFNRGVKYLSEVGVSRVPRASRSVVFHLCISGAAAAFGVCNAFNFHELPLILPLPWMYCARGVATALLFFAFSSIAGVGHVESMAVATMGFMAWVQLGAATTIHDSDLCWGLCISGVVCGALAVRTLSNMLERHADQTQIERGMARVSDLIMCCGILYIALWLVEASAILNSACAVLLFGFLDMLFVIGCGHLLLKPDNVDGAYMVIL